MVIIQIHQVIYCSLKKIESVKNADLTVDNSESFKYKVALLGKTADAVNNTNNSVKDIKIVVPLKYLSNFSRSLEIPLINCKFYPELNWI